MVVPDLISSLLTPEVMTHAEHGLQLGVVTFILTVVLEIWSFETVRTVLKQEGAGFPLYAAAVMANLRNHFLYGVPIYTAATVLFCREADDEVEAFDRIVGVSTILTVHSICFYAAHRAFHNYPNLYRHHRFHHRFNVHVPPMAANAVSSVEYIVAYILPFTVAMPIVRPDTVSIRLSVGIVAITNILIHTPKLGHISRMLPEWIVSTENHLEHHRKLNTKYAAPTLNVDYFMHYIEAGNKKTL